MGATERIMALYAGLPRAYGIYKIEETEKRGKKKGKAQTLQRDVTQELWASHLAGEIQIGIVPIRDDATCMFGAIDIDDYKTDHVALEQKIDRLKLPLTVIKSKSGGAHLYLFLSAPADAVDVRERLCDWAASLGYSGVEIFPKQNRLMNASDTGNWINMPYSGGDASDRHAIHKGVAVGLDAFLSLSEKRKTTLVASPDTNESPPELLDEAPPCLVTITSGGAGEGGRNTTLFNLGIYCRKRWPDDWSERVKEMNSQFISPALDDAEVNQIINHLAKKEYAYTCKDKPLSGVCNKSQCLKRQYGIGPSDAQEYFGIDIQNVLRVEFDPPKYYADFNGKRITFAADELNSQTKFRELVINQANESFMPVPAPRWAQFIIQLCSKAEIAEAPQETRINAEMIGWLEDYCIEQIPARSWSDVIDGQVYEEHDKMYFLPRKWITHAQKEHRVRLTIAEAYQALVSIGLVSEQKSINNKRYKVWCVPRFERPEQQEDDI